MQPPTIITGENPLVYVGLDERKQNEKYLKQFRCSICGKVVFEYYTNVNMIVPGEPPDNGREKILVIQCHGTITTHTDNGMLITSRCKSRYYISR